MREKILFISVLVLLGASELRAAQGVIPDANEAPSYDDVAAGLVASLEKDSRTAQDAARKLVSLGRRAVSVLTDVYDRNNKKGGNTQVLYYAVWSLSKIRTGDAAKPLVPLLIDEKADPELRKMAAESAGIEQLDEGLAALEKIASNSGDVELRKKAFATLSLAQKYIGKVEKLFVAALSDPDDDIRTLAAKQCYFYHIFFSATDKLIDLSEKDPVTAVRANAMLALSRMRIQRAVPMLARMAASEATPEDLRITAIRALEILTGTTLKNAAGVNAWWSKTGEKQYAKLEELTKKEAPENQKEEKKDPAPEGATKP